LTLRGCGIISAVSLAIALGGACAKRVYVQAEIDTSSYRRLAIFPFTTSITSDDHRVDGHQVADEVVVALLQHVPDLELVDRSHIQDLIWEGTVGEDSPEDVAAALRIGRLLGVDAVMVGSVSLSLEDITPIQDQVWRVANGVAVVRLFDAQDGRIVWAKRIERENSVLVDFHGDKLVWETDHEIIRQVVSDLAGAIAACFYPHEEEIR
jgi:TolB-like protein